jgi:hypothetical protein
MAQESDAPLRSVNNSGANRLTPARGVFGYSARLVVRLLAAPMLLSPAVAWAGGCALIDRDSAFARSESVFSGVVRDERDFLDGRLVLTQVSVRRVWKRRAATSVVLISRGSVARPGHEYLFFGDCVGPCVVVQADPCLPNSLIKSAASGVPVPFPPELVLSEELVGANWGAAERPYSAWFAVSGLVVGLGAAFSLVWLVVRRARRRLR